MLLLECSPVPAAELEAGPRTVVRSGLTKAQAEDLLDWLEANGRLPAEVWCHGRAWAVRYEVRPGD